SLLTQELLYFLLTHTRISYNNSLSLHDALPISVNDVVVHGFPNNYELKEGDIISVDCGFYRDGYHGDHAYTFAIGEISEEISKRSEEHTSELQSRENLVCRLLLEKKNFII